MKRIIKVIVAHAFINITNKQQNVVFRSLLYLSLSPQSGNLDRVDDLEDPLLPVDPVDVVAVQGRLEQELLDKLPEVDVGARP